MTSEAVGCPKLLDLSRAIRYGVRNWPYDDTGGRVEPHMGVVSLDGQDVFPERRLAEALPCDAGFLIRSHGKSLPGVGARFMNGTDRGGSEKKECCLIRRGLSFSIRERHPKLSEGPASSGRMPTCATWMQGRRSSC